MGPAPCGKRAQAPRSELGTGGLPGEGTQLQGGQAGPPRACAHCQETEPFSGGWVQALSLFFKDPRPPCWALRGQSGDGPGPTWVPRSFEGCGTVQAGRRTGKTAMWTPDTGQLLQRRGAPATQPSVSVSHGMLPSGRRPALLTYRRPQLARPRHLTTVALGLSRVVWVRGWAAWPCPQPCGRSQAVARSRLALLLWAVSGAAQDGTAGLPECGRERNRERRRGRGRTLLHNL